MPPYNINVSPVKVIFFVQVPLFHVNPVQQASHTSPFSHIHLLSHSLLSSLGVAQLPHIFDVNRISPELLGDGLQRIG